jgi:acyl dehydratase
MGITRYCKPVMIDDEDAKTTRLGGTIVLGRIALALASGLI